MKPWKVVVAALAVRGAGFLAAKRPEGKHLAGLWEFPGGKVEPGESPEDALCREVEEELGVNCKVGRLLDAVSYDYEDFSLLMLLYHVELGGEPQAREVAALRWVTATEFSELSVPPADEPLVKNLLHYLERIHERTDNL